MQKIELKQVKIQELQAAEYNPRKISEKELDKLKASISAFGLVEAIVINKDKTIIGGHQRVKACQELGMKEIPAFVVDLDKQSEKTLNLALNKISGEWDEDLLAQLMAELDADLQALSGFDDDEITGMLDALSTPDAEDEFEPELPTKPKSKTGQLYQLGEHRLLCGDATKPADYETLMAGDVASLLFTDPPYNVDYTGGTKSRLKIENDKKSETDFEAFLRDSLTPAIKNTMGVHYICMSSSEIHTLKRAYDAAGGRWSQFIMWIKNQFTLSRNDWQNQYEVILYGWNKGLTNHYFAGYRDESNVWKNLEHMQPEIDEEGKMRISLGNYILELNQVVTGKIMHKKNSLDIWNYKKPTRSTEHPTMKPIPLISKAIKASSKRGQIVLDPFGGSGSTLIAAEKFGRRCYMMEMDPRYVDVIIRRWELFTKQKAVEI